MNENKEYTISFSGLSIGEHSFSFEVGTSFFELFNCLDVHEGDVKVEVKLIKQATMLEFYLQLKGHVKMTCDRCTDDLLVDVNTNRKIIVKFTEEDPFEEEDIVFLKAGSYEITLDQHIYETLILSLPLRKVHQEGLCDEETIKKLDDLAPKKENKDPRWDALKNIELNLN